MSALPVVLVPLLCISSREQLAASLALVHRSVVRMRALVMAVTIVQAGECSAAFITLETRGWRRRGGLNGCPRGGRKRRRVWALENSRGDERGRGDVLNRLRLTAVILLTLLLRGLLLVWGIGLEGWWL